MNWARRKNVSVGKKCLPALFAALELARINQVRRWGAGHSMKFTFAHAAAAFLSSAMAAATCDRRIITLMGRHLLWRAINNASRRPVGASLVTGRAAKRHSVPGDCG